MGFFRRNFPPPDWNRAVRFLWGAFPAAPLFFALLAAHFPASAAAKGEPGVFNLSFQTRVESESFPFKGILNWTITRDLRAGPGFEVKLSGWDAEFGPLKGVLSANATLVPTGRGLEAKNFMAVLSRAGLETQSGRMDDLLLVLRADGFYSRAENSLRVDNATLSLDGKILCAGGLSLDLSKGTKEPQFEFSGEIPDLARLKSAFAPLLPARLAGMTVSGPLPFRAGYRLSDEPGGEAALRLEMSPKRLVFGAAGKKRILAGQVGFLSPDMGKTWRIKGGMEMNPDSRAKGGGVDLQAGLLLSSNATSYELHVENFSLAAGQGAGFGPVSAAGDVIFDRKGGFRTRDFNLSGPGLKRFEITLKRGESGLEGGVVGRGIEARPLAGLIQSLGLFPLRDWSPKGGFDLDGTFISGQGEENRFKAGIRLKQIGFQSPDGRIMADKTDGVLDLSWPLAGDARFRADLAVSRGDFLFGTRYVDFSKQKLTGFLSGGMTGAQRLEAATFRAELSGIGRLMGGGALYWGGAGPGFKGKVKAADIDLGRAFNLFVRDPLVLANPKIGAVEVSGRGELEAEVAAGPESVRARGRLTLSGAGVDAREDKSGGGPPRGVLARDISLDLPFDCLVGDKPLSREAAKAGQGELKVGLVRTVLGEFSLAAPLKLEQNRLIVGSDLVLPLLDGRVVLSRVRIEDPFSGEARAEFGAELEGIRLDRLRKAGLGSVPLDGVVNGRFERIAVDRKEVATRGGLGGEVFGGELKADGLGMINPFAEDRRITARISLEKMDFERLSQALGVGRISGRLSLKLDDLVLAYGQPSSFKLWASSIPVKGVDQEISLKAVNSISVLGSGSGMVGVGAFASFFKSFSYETIGFTCDLNNDLFRVRGLIKEGGVEYIVKKPPLFGINVINGNPNNFISFSDMLKRLKRVVSPKDPRLDMGD